MRVKDGADSRSGRNSRSKESKIPRIDSPDDSAWNRGISLIPAKERPIIAANRFRSGLRKKPETTQIEMTLLMAGKSDNHQILASVLACFLYLFSPPCIPSGQILQEARVAAVNDGDTVTLLLNGKRYRARLIGIDAPEMGQEPWGRLSREHLRKLLKKSNWRVAVEKDVEHRDKYNRLLVYLWSPDGQLINENMLRDGYAVLFTIQPNSKYAERFRKAQHAARESKKGIWGADGLKEKPLDYKKAHPRISAIAIMEGLHSQHLLSLRCQVRSGPEQRA